MESAGLSKDARDVIELDARYVLAHGFRTPQLSEAWPATRVRRGLVVGAVQSGKTASMLALSALLLDEGIDVLVLLAGTRIALWRQTVDRAVRQLDRWSPETDAARRRERIWLPRPDLLATGSPRPELDVLYREPPNLMTRRLLKGKPVVACVMKHVDHLSRFGTHLMRVLRGANDRLDRPLHMVVIDDEADDGSILDAAVESGVHELELDGLKQLPRYIARLWGAESDSGTTAIERLHATYVAYTATPQANLLQEDHNPLSPSEFVVALRTPLDEGSIAPPRAPTFRESLGATRYYCGGELFYRRLHESDERPCVARAFPTREHGEPADAHLARIRSANDELLFDGLRAYFVAGAVRLLLSGRRLSQVQDVTFGSSDDYARVRPPTHCMLVHPSGSVAAHFEVAALIAAWASGADDAACPAAIADVAPTLDAQGLSGRVSAKEDAWRSWLARYARSSALLSLLPGASYEPLPDDLWPEVRRLLITEVFPHARIAVINSDPRADDRPQFEPEVTPGGVRAARDIFTIFVSGNVMSRGLTLEGLCTTVFRREANTPAADTQMQMQRWFGYRGRQLPFCRVFLYQDQLRLFQQYHENDEAMRREIIRAMNDTPGVAPTPLVLQGRQFVATKKITNLRNVALHPGASPFVRVAEIADGVVRTHNAGVLARLFAEEEWADLDFDGPKGRIVRRTFDLLEVAELLESLRYSHHDPSPELEQNARWASLERQLGLGEPESPLFRAPGRLDERPCAVLPRFCPYSIAAYLRLWKAALTRRARGLVPTDRPDLPWAYADLRTYQRRQPQFYVGVRFGSAPTSSLAGLESVPCMLRSVDGGYVAATWGSRGNQDGTGYLGDHLFDYHWHNRTPPTRVAEEPEWRPSGAPGLLLFQVLRDRATDVETLTVGLGVPLGGPDHFAAFRSGSLPGEEDA